ncbi:MAG: DUF814 domain-containing protein [Candidatus Altiarchaeales archaeon]|nr:DUF814 domain-containing protein [Candidatus Altiarchaeales archaeon]
MDIELDLRKSAVENARNCYEKAKKAREKVKGAVKALEETKLRISNLSENSIVEKEGVRKKTLKERRWFDKFRWFESSDGFLVVGGRDAVTNEILVKKHLEKNDLVFHADIQGAPFFVVKNSGNRSVPERTLKEAAEAAASYSSAWKKGHGSCDIYYVNPDQVSKKAESGEYIPKGGFMVRGVKNWLRNIELKMAIGFVLDDAVEVVGGPVSAVEAKTKYYARIGVGDLKSKELALEIKKEVQRKTSREDGARIKNVSLDEIQKYVPNGKSRILS